MPLPLIVGLGIGIGTAVTGTVRTFTGAGRIKRAKKRYERRRVAYERAEATYKARQQEADAQLQAFGKERLEATVTLGRAAEFLKKARVKDREHFEQVEVPADTRH